MTSVLTASSNFIQIPIDRVEIDIQDDSRFFSYSTETAYLIPLREGNIALYLGFDYNTDSEIYNFAKLCGEAQYGSGKNLDLNVEPEKKFLKLVVGNHHQRKRLFKSVDNNYRVWRFGLYSSTGDQAMGLTFRFKKPNFYYEKLKIMLDKLQP